MPPARTSGRSVGQRNPARTQAVAKTIRSAPRYQRPTRGCRPGPLWASIATIPVTIATTAAATCTLRKVKKTAAVEATFRPKNGSKWTMLPSTQLEGNDTRIDSRSALQGTAGGGGGLQG